MFSTKTKRLISDAVQQILRATNNTELPPGEITFHLHVDGDDPNMSWADIRNNGAIPDFPVLPDESQQVVAADSAFATDMKGFVLFIPKGKKP